MIVEYIPTKKDNRNNLINKMLLLSNIKSSNIFESHLTNEQINSFYDKLIIIDIDILVIEIIEYYGKKMLNEFSDFLLTDKFEKESKEEKMDLDANKTNEIIIVGGKNFDAKAFGDRMEIIMSKFLRKICSRIIWAWLKERKEDDKTASLKSLSRVYLMKKDNKLCMNSW